VLNSLLITVLFVTSIAQYRNKSKMFSFCLFKKRHITLRWFLSTKVYQSSTDEYICHSKYHGRRLDSDGVRRTLRCFLHDGRRLLTELVCSILDRLQRLEKVIKRLDSYRFYSSSLLIMYDGADTDCGDTKRETSPRQLAVCMIDFAHATHSGFLGDPVVHIGPDRGYLFGLQNLIRLFEEILADANECSGE